MLFRSAALFHCTFLWEWRLNRHGSQLLRRQYGVANSVYFRKGKALYTPHPPQEVEAAASTGIRVSCGSWRLAQVVLSQVMAASAGCSLGRRKLAGFKEVTYCILNWFSLVFRSARVCWLPSTLCLGKRLPAVPKYQKRRSRSFIKIHFLFHPEP